MTTSKAPVTPVGAGGEPPESKAGDPVGGDRPEERFEKRTYTYVRTTIVCLLVGLTAAVFYEAGRQGFGFLPSVSAYYYTPAQALFVGGLIGLGACTIALKSANIIEDVCLNLAGMFAAVVAIVPTSRGEDFRAAVRACDQGDGPLLTERATTGLDCPTVEALTAATRANVENNMIALLVAGLLGLAASMFLAVRMKGKARDKDGSQSSFWGFVTASVIVLVATATFFAATDWFIDHAHNIAAFSLFGCIVVVVLANALRRERKQLSISSSGLSDLRGVLVQKPKKINLYGWIAWTMVVASGAGIVLLLVGAISVFLLEIVVALLFVVFWSVQTIDRAPRPVTRASGPRYQ